MNLSRALLTTLLSVFLTTGLSAQETVKDSVLPSPGRFPWACLPTSGPPSLKMAFQSPIICCSCIPTNPGIAA